jgi:hypothetical protein
MVKGLPIFRKHFAGYEDSFVLIGGVACDEWFARYGREFRPTQDIDMVLILEAIRPDFFRHFWAFVEQGQYEFCRRADGDKVYFRFEKPASAAYPALIELFSPAPLRIEPFPGQRIVPIATGEDIDSLSAILMDADYYRFVMDQRESVEGLPLLKPAGLIVLKAKAWMDLSKRRAEGDASVDEDDVKKHRTDVFRLASILPVGESVQLSEPLTVDLRRFLAAFPGMSPEWPAILQSLRTKGIRMAAVELLRTLREHFGISEGPS